MKQTITSLALPLLCTSGMAMAAPAYTYTVDFTNTTTATTVTGGGSNLPGIGTPVTTGVDTPILSVGSDSLTATHTTAAGDITLTNYNREILFAGGNVGLDSQVTYGITFTALEGSTLDTVKLALLTFNSVGYNHTNAPKVNYTFTIESVTSGKEVSTLPTVEDFALNFSYSSDQSYASAPEYTFDGGITKGSGAILTIGNLGLELNEGEQYKLNIVLNKGTSDKVGGFFVGVGGVQMKGTVPEPATATLSLLALAGLAARRRRK